MLRRGSWMKQIKAAKEVTTGHFVCEKNIQGRFVIFLFDKNWCLRTESTLLDPCRRPLSFQGIALQMIFRSYRMSLRDLGKQTCRRFIYLFLNSLSAKLISAVSRNIWDRLLGGARWSREHFAELCKVGRRY